MRDYKLTEEGCETLAELVAEADARIDEANRRNAERLERRYTPEYIAQRLAYLEQLVRGREARQRARRRGV